MVNKTSANFDQESLRHYLKAELKVRQGRNPNYSLRAFARDLAMSPSHFSEYLRGLKSVSNSQYLQLSRRLGREPAQNRTATPTWDFVTTVGLREDQLTHCQSHISLYLEDLTAAFPQGADEAKQNYTIAIRMFPTVTS